MKKEHHQSRQSNSDGGLEGHMFTQGLRFDEEGASPTGEYLTREAPLQILINGKPYTVTMRTPGEDTFLGVGLLLAEQCIESWDDVEAVEHRACRGFPGSARLNVILNSKRPRQKIPSRRLVSSASCGVCGMASLSDLQIPEIPLPKSAPMDLEVLRELEGKMKQAQSLFHRTGGCHGAAVFDAQGNLLILQEDVGRHNAVDKAVGMLLMRRNLKQASILFVSGRVSYEIAIKAYRAGIPYLLAVSAPSGLAVDLCRSLGITLLGFCRENRATAYTYFEKIKPSVLQS